MSADQQGGCNEVEHATASRGRYDLSSAIDLGIRTHVNALLHIVGDVGGLQIVDLGCGEGHFGRELANKGARVTGIDPSIASLPKQSFASGTFRILQGSGEAVPLPAASADLVTFVFSLHHMPGAALAACLHEAIRLLRPSGRLYVAEPLAEGPLHYLTMPFHDETQVRANALSALAELRSECETKDLFLYCERRVFANFDAFAQRMIANMRFNDYDAKQVTNPHVIGRFNELFIQNGGNFDQPVLVNVYSRPAVRT
jgi:ubiquinone/menaquinone biosynthesis C-methylase UbiE